MNLIFQQSNVILIEFVIRGVGEILICLYSIRLEVVLACWCVSQTYQETP